MCSDALNCASQVRRTDPQYSAVSSISRHHTFPRQYLRHRMVPREFGHQSGVSPVRVPAITTCWSRCAKLTTLPSFAAMSMHATCGRLPQPKLASNWEVLARLPDLTSTLRADRSPLLFAQAWNRPATTPRTMVLLQSTWRSSTRMRACTACWSGGWTSLMLQRHAALHCQACLPCQRRPWGSRQSRGVLRGTRRRRCVWGAHSDETLRRRAYTCQGPSGTAWWS